MEPLKTSDFAKASKRIFGSAHEHRRNLHFWNNRYSLQADVYFAMPT